ncbi:MlaA family lipoprotein [Arenibaculum pallidiluteum]|uniref:MlaA family lipoprotein n=1 Tax=Arenibaculum pallidiluteum TaxID=2812559 RepID=UPI001A97C5EE|nr:VacJ family lipoprotein [Arenibaculum pallidiluteum]
MVLLLALPGCAQVPTDPVARAAYEEANDPAEPVNRVIFAGNQWVDRNLLQPPIRAYEEYVPDRVRNSVRNFGRNLEAPSIAVNDVLQANFDRAWTTTQRFVVNTTLGGAGLFDVATDWDLPHHDADFGQTFGVWGIGTGPSIQLPLLGPSNVRDTVGTVAGILGNPLGFVQADAVQTAQMVGSGTDLVSQRADMLKVTDDLEKNSMDYYVALRSMYAQRRAALVDEGRSGGPTASEEFEVIEDIGPVTPAEPSIQDEP